MNLPQGLHIFVNDAEDPDMLTFGPLHKLVFPVFLQSKTLKLRRPLIQRFSLFSQKNLFMTMSLDISITANKEAMLTKDKFSEGLHDFLDVL